MNGRSALAALRGLLFHGAPALAPAAAVADRLTDEPAVLTLGLEDGPALVDFDNCPREQRRQPHAISDDGSRQCFNCGHTTPGRTR